MSNVTIEMLYARGSPRARVATANRLKCHYTFAAVRKSDAASVASQVNSGSSRPKCP